jgi:hypothetical protein
MDVMHYVTSVERDPNTFSILTEEPGQIGFTTMLDGIAVHEDWTS